MKKDELDIGELPKISKLIETLNKVKDEFGDIECDIIYDGYTEQPFELFVANNNHLILFMS